MSSRYDDEGWTHEEFLEKMDSEGGVEEMLNWGGPGSFPPECRENAERVFGALNNLHEDLHAIGGW